MTKGVGCIASILIMAAMGIVVKFHIPVSIWIWIIGGLFLWQFIALSIFGNGDGSSRTPSEFIADVKHNRAIDKQWEKDGQPIVLTSVGWRPSPFEKDDGYKDNGFDKNLGGDGHSYSRLLRGGTKEYREKFARDVEEASK